MLPRALRCFSFTYFSSFFYGVLPFAYVNGRFVASKLGVELWTGQLCMTVAMNVSNYIDSLASPCNNALSCAVYIQTLLNGVTVVAQVLLILHNRVQICDCLNRLTDVRFASEEVFSECDSNVQHSVGCRSQVVLPVAYNAIFTLFTVARCTFMFAVKPKTPLIQMVQYLCTVTQIQIENISITLIHIVAAEFKNLSEGLKSMKIVDCKLEKLQEFHLMLHGFCRQIEKSFGLNITISVFTVLTQLLLMTFFETTLNIRPLKRNFMMDLYLVLNITYAIVNLARIAAICKGCDLVRTGYKDINLKLQHLASSREGLNYKLKSFNAHSHILQFRFTGCSLFTMSMELVTEIVSAVAIYATTIVSFTTFSSDTSVVYSSYVKKAS